MKKLFSVVSLLLLSSISFASYIANSLSQVNLQCEGDIFSVEKKTSEAKIVASQKVFVSVINPWYGRYNEQKNLKEPQDIVVLGQLAATVKKSVNSEKEIVLEVYAINPETQGRERVAFAAGEPVNNGLSLNASVGQYETIFRCKEVK